LLSKLFEEFMATVEKTRSDLLEFWSGCEGDFGGTST